MLIKIGSQQYEPEFVQDNDEVWRITDKLVVEKGGNKSHELKTVDFGTRIYGSQNDIKIYHSKPVAAAKVDLTTLTEFKETVLDEINDLQLRTCKMVEYIGIPNTDAATPLDQLYYRDMHVFTIFKSDLLSGACIGIEQVALNNNSDKNELFGRSFRICHFFVLQPFQGMGIGRLLYSTVKSFAEKRFQRLCVEDPNELFSNLRDHCDLDEFARFGGLMALKSKSQATAKKAKLDPTVFIGKYAAIKHYIQKLEKALHLSPDQAVRVYEMGILMEMSRDMENKFDLLKNFEDMSKVMGMMADRIQTQNQTIDVMLPVEQDQTQSLQQTSLLRVQDYLDMLNKMK